MKKQSLLIFLTIFIISLFTGCSSSKHLDYAALAKEKENSGKFILLYDASSSGIHDIDIYVDTDTGVEYVCTYGNYGGKFFTPRVGIDGKPIIDKTYVKNIH